MLEVVILSGSRLGDRISIREFPVTIGRASDAGIRLVDPGVWDRHAVLVRDEAGTIRITASGEASLAIDGESVKEKAIRNGSTADCGSIRLRIELATPIQKSLNGITMLFWVMIAAVVMLELFLVLAFGRAGG